MSKPCGCIEAHPTKQTIWLRGVPINLNQAARLQQMDEGYLSRILAGIRDPYSMGVRQALKLASVLGMELEDMLGAICERRDLLARGRVAVTFEHRERVRREARHDAALRRAGRVPAPRLPLSTNV